MPGLDRHGSPRHAQVRRRLILSTSVLRSAAVNHPCGGPATTPHRTTSITLSHASTVLRYTLTYIVVFVAFCLAAYLLHHVLPIDLTPSIDVTCPARTPVDRRA